MSTSAVRIVEAVLSAAVWLMKLNRLSSAGSHDDENGGTIRYVTRCYFNVRSKADISQLNLPHGSGDGTLLSNGCLYSSNQQVLHGCTLTGL